MSKNYDLYPNSERKIDNWRRRILGYEKMKRDLQRQIQLLKNKNKKQKEVIDRLNFIKNRKNQGASQENINKMAIEFVNSWLKEVSK